LTDYNKFQLWLEYEKIAVHFNELLMQLRLRALAGVSLIVSLAGFFSSKGNGEMNWIVLAFVLFVLVCVWIAIFVIDKFYYQRLLGGAVEAILELEAGTACDPIPINLSTKIRKRATNGSIDSNSHRAYPINLTINIVVFVYEAVDFHLRAYLRDFRRTFDFQVFDDGDPIAFGQQITVHVFIDPFIGERGIGAPFMGAFGAD